MAQVAEWQAKDFARILRAVPRLVDFPAKNLPSLTQLLIHPVERIGIVMDKCLSRPVPHVDVMWNAPRIICRVFREMLPKRG